MREPRAGRARLRRRRANGVGRDDRRAPRGDLQRDADAAVRDAARRDRGAAASATGAREMQIHFALSEPPRWEGDDRLGQTAIVHLTPGLDGVSRAVNEADRGLLPAEATVVVGQPLTMDFVARAGREGPALDPAAGAAVARQGRRRRASSTSATARGPRRCASATPIASRPGSRAHIPNLESSILGAHGALTRRSAGRERQPGARRPVRRLAGARPELPLARSRTARSSTASGTSAPRPTQAPVSAAAAAPWSRPSYSSRRSASGSRRSSGRSSRTWFASEPGSVWDRTWFASFVRERAKTLEPRSNEVRESRAATRSGPGGSRHS